NTTSSSLTMVKTPNAMPATVATTRRGRRGSTSASATSTSASMGRRMNWMGVNRSRRSGATRTAQTTPTATTAVVRRTTLWLTGPAPVRYSQKMLWAKDSISSTSATPTATRLTRCGSAPDAATVSTMAWTAATTLPQYRGGNGAANHGT